MGHRTAFAILALFFSLVMSFSIGAHKGSNVNKICKAVTIRRLSILSVLEGFISYHKNRFSNRHCLASCQVISPACHDAAPSLTKTLCWGVLPLQPQVVPTKTGPQLKATSEKILERALEREQQREHWREQREVVPLQVVSSKTGSKLKAASTGCCCPLVPRFACF